MMIGDRHQGTGGQGFASADHQAPQQEERPDAAYAEDDRRQAQRPRALAERFNAQARQEGEEHVLILRGEDGQQISHRQLHEIDQRQHFIKPEVRFQTPYPQTQCHETHRSQGYPYPGRRSLRHRRALFLVIPQIGPRHHEHDAVPHQQDPKQRRPPLERTRRIAHHRQPQPVGRNGRRRADQGNPGDEENQ